MQTEIFEKISRIQEQDGWTKPLSLTQMEEAWEGFVEVCEKGYNWNVEEYDNDLSIRDRIELVLSCEELRDFPAIEHLRSTTTSVDRRFRTLLREDVRIKSEDAPWWRRGVLRSAGSDYARDMLSLYGIEVEMADDR